MVPFISAVFLLALLICSGCIGFVPLNKADPDTREEITAEILAVSIPGPRNKEEILLRFGEPDEVSPDGRRMIYSWNKIKGTGWLIFIYPPIVYFDTYKKRYRLVITLNEKGYIQRTKIIDEAVLKYEKFWQPFYADDYVAIHGSEIGVKVPEGRKINVGPFTATDMGKWEIRCRAVGPVRTPYGDSFSEYIREALIAELTSVGIFSLDAPVLISGNLDRIDFDSFPPAKWEFTLTFGASSGKLWTKTFDYSFTSSYFADTCCELTARAFRPAVQGLLNSILQSQEFFELVSK